ncbi:MAG: anti-sigma factor [Saprospiraceae bacterium]
MTNLKLVFLVVLSAFFIASCTTDEETPTTDTFTLDISGLEDLGDDYAYEGWLIVDGSPVSAGIFNVDANGELSATSFEVDVADLENATAYVLTIEPSPDNDPAPSSVHILAGDFSGDAAAITVDHASAIGTNFTTSTGEFILATPTDGSMTTDELSGVWWLNPSGPEASLDLPTLPEGWKYEGWAVIDGTPVSTGTFTSVSGSDDAAPFSGTTAGPAYPGEDFLMNAPTGLTFPTDLTGGTIVISVEPSPDNSAAPFLLKPLVGTVPTGATDRTLYGMNNNAMNTNPTGTVTK